MDNYAIIVGYFLLLAIAPSSLGKIISAIPQDVHWRVDYSLLTFAAYYDGFCREGEQPGLKDFERVASVVEDLGHDKRLNITFLKVDRKGDPGAIRDFGVMYSFCSGNPTFTLYRYGLKKDYGYQGSVEKMLDWLRKNAEPSLTIITTRPDLASFIATKKYSVVGYFKDPKLWRYFYTAADSDDLQGIDFADVQNSDLRSAYSKDTVVVNQKFGQIQIALNENLTVERIATFVKVNTHFIKPILMHDWSPSELIDAVQNTSVIFVQFYTNQCPVASFVKQAAQVGHDNGMLDYLDMKFASVNMTKYRDNLETFGLTPNTCRDKSLWSAPLVMRLFRYGRMIKYADTFVSQQTFTLEGLLQWLEKNTKPATRMVEEPEDLNLIVNYHETSIIGYFKDGSDARNVFRRVAELFPKYTFGEIVSPDMNPFSEDVVILYELYGESFKNLTGNFTRDKLNNFVSSNVHQDLPVNTRPTPTPVPDFVYRSAKQIAIFDKIKFKGNSLIIQLSDNCTEIPETWGRGTWSIKTFGECVDFFEDVGCRSSSKNFRLDMTESRHSDIGPVKPPSGFRSMDFCSKWKDATSSASFIQYSVRQPFVVCYFLLRLMLNA